MKKADIEIDASAEIILIIIGLILLIILFAGIFMNLDKIGDLLKSLMGGVF
jgi:uncharacterized membrane protein (UPF0182 family)